MPKELLSVVERQCKALIKTVGTYMMPKLFSYGLNFLLIPVLTRVLTPADLGIVALAWAVHNTLAGVCSLGIPGAVSRYYFEYRKDDQKLASLIVSSRWVMYGLLIVSTVVMAIFCGPLALMVGVDKSFADAFFWIFITAYINQVMSLYLNLFQNMERPFAYSLWLCVQAGVGFSLTLIFIFIFHLSYMGMVFGALFGAVIACAGASWHLREFNAGRWSQETMRENVIYGLSITPKSLSSFVNRFFDKYMLNNI